MNLSMYNARAVTLLYGTCRALLPIPQTRGVHTKLAHVVYKHKDIPSKQPPLFLLHGLFGSKQNWQSLAKAMANNGELTVVTVDARNHGESSHSGEMTYEAMAADVSNLISDLGFDDAYILGHSMGGKSAMALALSEQKKVRKLIVEDVAPSKSPVDFDFRRYVTSMSKVQFDNSLTMGETRICVDRQLQSTVTAAPVRAYLLQNIIKRADGSYGWRLNLQAIEQSLINLFSFPESAMSYNKDTLFIGGSESSYLSDRDGMHANVKKLFPRAKFHFIAGAGHWVHSDKPHEFQSVVLDFVKA